MSAKGEISARNATDIFEGGGQMGALMRSIDWTKTPVGPVQDWPQSLKTALSILLKQRTPVFIFWGPEHVQFYNDAYRPILGSRKHPTAMGQRGEECWPEIWDIILPMLQAVHRGESTGVEDGLLVIDRDGYPEEGYYTYTYSPIADESGAVAGVFCVVYDTTARVIGERRLRTLRDLASRQMPKDAETACRSAAATLAGNPYDIPFALLYLYDESRKSAKLAGAAGVAPGLALSPENLTLEGESLPVIAEAAKLMRAVEIPDLARTVGPLPGGPWSEGGDSAMVLPLLLPGQPLPAGFLVAGINPHKRLDSNYRMFFDLLVSQIATAIAEAKAYEEERKRAESLAELDRAKTAFFSNVSHEFRTPLTLMLGPLSDVLTRPSVSPEEFREELTVAHRNCLRLLKLVNTLLDFSRIEAGRIQALYEPTDLPTLTADLASVFRSAMEKAGLWLTVDCPPLDELVFVDREMWEKIVLNLLSNAFKFTFEGGIGIAIKAAGGEVELVVRDTGVGIPEPQLAHVFERFHRIEGTRGRSQEGSGIGLALVHELVRLHGGTVSVESQHGQGSTFRVRIPFGRGHLPPERVAPGPANTPSEPRARAYLEEALRWLPDAPPPPTTLDLASPAESLGGKTARAPGEQRFRILVADDNSDMREYLCRLLRDSYRVEAVPDGQAALASLEKDPPDLLLADVMMPGLDGFHLLEKVRGHPLLRTLPVILLSARAGEESRVEGLRAGADDYVVKPFSARELLVRISSRLEIARLRKQSAEAERRLLAETAAERQKLRDLIQQAPAAIAVLRGPDHIFDLVNGDAAIALNRPDESLIGKPIREAVPEFGEQGFVDLLDKVYRTGIPYSAKETLVKVDSRGGQFEERYFNFVYQPCRDAGGDIEAILVHAVDISGQVSARQRIEASERLLRKVVNKEREARATAELLNRIGPVLLSQLDSQNLVESITSLAAEGVGARFGAFLKKLPAGDSQEHVLHRLAGTPPEVFQEFSPPGGAEIFEPILRSPYPVRCPDVRADPRFGKTWPAGSSRKTPAVRSYLACPVVSPSGDVFGALLLGHTRKGRFTRRHESILSGIAAQAAIAMDNARLFEKARETQRKLENSIDELQRAYQDMETFAYSASHDLQEPIRNITVYTQLLQRDHGILLKGEPAELLDGILSGVLRMHTLIKDLLAFCRATKGIDRPPGIVSAEAVLRGVLKDLKIALQQSCAEIECEPLPSVAIHETHLSLLFQNLIANALKYRKERHPHVRIAAVRGDAEWIFSVEDNGIGIDPKCHRTIFGLFTRLHGPDEYPGSGVGLAICQRIVERYGGRIWVESIEGQGSTFSFTIPDSRGPASGPV